MYSINIMDRKTVNTTSSIVHVLWTGKLLMVHTSSSSTVLSSIREYDANRNQESNLFF